MNYKPKTRSRNRENGKTTSLMICVIILIMLIIISIYLIFKDSEEAKMNIEEQTITVSFNDTGNYEYDVNCNFTVTKDTNKVKYIHIEDNIYEVFINGEKARVGYRDNFYVDIQEMDIHYDFKEGEVYNLTFRHKGLKRNYAELNDLTSYKNVLLYELRLSNPGDYIKNTKIVVKTEEENQIFEAANESKYDNNKIKKVEKISNKEYIVYLNTIRNSPKISIIFDAHNEAYRASLSKYGIKKEYINVEKFSKNYAEDRISYLMMILVVGIVIYFITKIGNMLIRRESKAEDDNYLYRDIENLINPVWAEFLIDKKTDIGKLFVTIMLELQHKNKVRIEKDEIHLLNSENLEDYEKEIIYLIFQDGNVVKIDEIARKLKKRKVSFMILENIKESIRSNLIKEGIIDSKIEKYNNFIRSIEMIILLNIPIAAICWLIADFKLAMILNLAVVIVVYLTNFRFSINASIRELYTISNIRWLYITFPITAMLIPIGMFGFSELRPGDWISGMLIVIDIIVVLSINFSYLEKYKLTNKGREERIKLIGFKNFLKEYTLIKEKSMDEAALWEKSLIYATALGVNNSDITKEIESTYFKLKAILEFQEKVG